VSNWLEFRWPRIALGFVLVWVALCCACSKPKPSDHFDLPVISSGGGSVDYPAGVVAWISGGGYICLPIGGGSCEETPAIKAGIPPRVGEIACLGDQAITDHTMPVRCTEEMVKKPESHTDDWSGQPGVWYQEPKPFDVPPKQWDDPYRVEINSDPPSTTEHHIACEDKSRFLLQSEDGKWHCLALVRP